MPAQPTRSGQVTRSVSFDLPQWRPLAGGKGKWELAGAPVFTAEGMPELPVQVERFAVPVGFEARVHVSGGEWAESESGLKLELTGAPFVWGPDEFRIAGKARGRFFPGRLFEAKSVGGEVWVSLYPLQYDRETGQVVEWRGGRIDVDFLSQPRVFRAVRGPTAVILTSSRLAAAAETLRRYHRDVLGVTSQIVYVEGLTRESMLPEDQYPDGYKELGTVHGITVYPFPTARRIARYFRRQIGPGSALRYLTILGDATVVPPSYYFSVRAAYGPMFGPTDACYVSTDQCMSPQAAVGRLPFRTGDQLDNYLRKLTEWLETDSPGPELALYGGKAFRGYQFIGELGAIRALPGTSTNWEGVEKYFRTLGNFDKGQTLKLVAGGQRAKLAYYLDHGRGNEWYVEKAFVSAKEVAAAVPVADRVNPFLLSISCTNGAFDRDLVDSEFFGPSSSGPESVGVALLKSRAGVVGYLGSARPALGNPLFSLDESGNLKLSGSTYTMQILDSFLMRYHDEAEGRAGDLLLATQRQYAAGSGNELDDDHHRWVYLNLVLLADPVAPMRPRRHFGDAADGASVNTRFPNPSQGNSLPYFTAAASGLLKFPLGVDALESTRATLLRVDRNQDKEWIVGKNEFAIGKSSWNWEIEADKAPGVYLLKLENTRGVPIERQAWFGVAAPRPGT